MIKIVLTWICAPMTPQENGVIKRENRTPQEMEKTMLHENNLSNYS